MRVGGEDVLVIELQSEQRFLRIAASPGFPRYGTAVNLDVCSYPSDGDCDDGGAGATYEFVRVAPTSPLRSALDLVYNATARAEGACRQNATQDTNRFQLWICKTALFVSSILYVFAKMYGLREKGKGQGHVIACENRKAVAFIDGIITGDGANFLSITGMKWDENASLYKMEFDWLQDLFAVCLAILALVAVVGTIAAACESDEKIAERGKTSPTFILVRCIGGGLALGVVFGLVVTGLGIMNELDSLLPEEVYGSDSKGGSYAVVDPPAPPPPASPSTPDSDGTPGWLKFIGAYFGWTNPGGGPFSSTSYS